MKQDSALTWLQTLALAAVILFALALLFPMTTTARSGGRSILCMTNLHILGKAWLAYQEDNDGKLVNGHVPRSSVYANTPYWLTTSSFSGPYKDNAWWVNPPHQPDGTYAGGSWDGFVCSLADEDNGIRSGKLFPYVGSSAAYHCPADLSWRRTKYRGGKRSYTITAVMHGDLPNDPDTADLYSQIVRPSEKMVFVENTDTRGWNMGCWCLWASPAPMWVDALPVFHGTFSVFGFADGHAEFHTWQNILEQDGLRSVAPNPSPDLYFLASRYLPKK